MCVMCKMNVRRMFVRQSVPRVRLHDGIGGLPLSPRELAVMRLLAGGQSNKEVATSLNISVKTVETYRARVMLKLDVHSVVELVHFAYRSKVLTVPE